MKSNTVASSAFARHVTPFILALCLAAPADARRTAIDFDDSAIAVDGQSFSSDTTHCGAADTQPASCRLNLFGDLSAGPIKLGFTIRVGTQNFDALFVNEAGIVTFGSALDPSGDFTPVADFAALQQHVPQPFIAPFYANLQTVDGTAPEDPFTVTNGGVMYGRGSADPTEPFSSAGLVPAMHVGWVEDTSVISSPVATQVVIYFTGNTSDADTTNDGDFAFRIRYGLNDTDQYNVPDAPTGVAGFSLPTGSDAKALTGALRAADDYFFSFHNGHLSAAGTASFTLTPPTLAFGNQALFTSSQRDYTFTNTGTVALPIQSIEVRGTDRALFTFANHCGTSVAVGANCKITMTFRPTSVGSKSATLRLVAGNLTRRRALTGTGVKSTYTVSPTSLAFGNVPRNTTSAAKSVKISNTGTVLLPINSISLGGANPGQFGRTHNCPSSVAVGGSCTVQVVFKPTSTGNKSATLVISTGGGAAAKSVPLTGTGT